MFRLYRAAKDPLQKMKEKRSKECYKELKKQKLIKHYPAMSVKQSGSQKGVILHGKSKSGKDKKVFVKKYNLETASLSDFAVFTIIKKCGGKVPKVKLKGSLRCSTYLFSADVTQSSPHVDRQYEYHEFTDKTFHATQSNIELKQSFCGSTAFQIDKISLARMLIMVEIFNLRDLYDANTGMAVSSEKNAKLCFVDFLSDLHELDCSGDHDLSVFIRSGYSDGMMDQRYYEMIFRLDISDYIQAFTKIEENFFTACESVMKQIDEMTFIGKHSKETIRDKYMPVWQKNFEAIQRLVNQAKSNTAAFRLTE